MMRQIGRNPMRTVRRLELTGYALLALLFGGPAVARLPHGAIGRALETFHAARGIWMRRAC